MSTIQGESPFEAQLRGAFVRGDLPPAPAGLRDALERVPDEPVAAAEPGRRTAGRSTGRGVLGALGVAAVLLIGGVIALSGGGRFAGPAPSSPPPSLVPTIVVTYQVDWTAATPFAPATLAAEQDILRRRLVTFGFHADVRADGTDRIVVTAPNGTDEAWRRTVSQTGRVAFVPLGDQPAEKGDAIDPATFPELFGSDGIVGASIGTNQTGSRVVTITLAPAAATLFATYTKTHVGSYLAITLDGTVLSAPVIQGEIPDGSIEISQGTVGGWDLTEARRFVSFVASGPLPVPLHEVSVASGPPGPAAESIDPAAPTPDIASTEASTAPSLSQPPYAIDCERPPNVAGDRMDCHRAVDTVVAMLPPNAPSIAKVTFRFACIDVTGGNTVYDCATQAFGLVTVEFAAGDPFIVQLSLGDRPRVVAPWGGDAGARIPLAEAAPAEPCADTLPGASIRVRMDPAAQVPVWAETAAGQHVPLRIRGGVFAISKPFAMILDADRHLLAQDGTVISLGDVLRVGVGYCLAASHGALVISGAP